MSFEKIGKMISTLLNVLEILATGNLTGAIMKLFHAKEISKATGGVDSAVGAKTDDSKIHPLPFDLGVDDNLLREEFVNLLATKDQARQTAYRNFATWLKEKDLIVYSAWEHFFTAQAKKLPEQAAITLNNIVDIIMYRGGHGAALTYVRDLTEEIQLKVLKAYGKKFLSFVEELGENYPHLSKAELARLLTRAACKVEDGLDRVEAWVKMQEADSFWTKLFCPWRIFRMPPDVSNYNPNYHSNGGGV